MIQLQTNRPGTGATKDTLRRAAALTLGRPSLEDEPEVKRRSELQVHTDAIFLPKAPLSARTPRRAPGAQYGSYRPQVAPLKTDGDIADREIAAMLHHVGTKCAQKFSKARQAFRFVDVNKDGKISREEIAQFFDVFNMPKDRVNCFFDFLDEDRSGDVETCEFIAKMWPFINPGCDEQAPTFLNHEAIEREEEAEAKQANVFRHPHVPITDIRSLPHDLQLMRARIIQKLDIKHKRRALHFKSVVGDHNGDVTLEDMRSFFESIGWPEHVADRFFAVLDPHGFGVVPRISFVELFNGDQDAEHRRLLRVT
eukprot:TRINITY_DN2045_c0_g3_i1.p1 TRINITY_DN2045_c0_g3~~TRINITY_DN2045_c0_g3_i1.p1  ORF type:complete len:311 (+),score=36.29 TRINITY_DN2045_c0_g3_i1:112-1044(+)